MNILITGIRGTIGSFLAQKLSTEHTVYGLDHITDSIMGVEQVFTCTEFSAIPEVDVVVHLAGRSSDTMDMEKSLEYIENNVGLTQCVYEWFRKSNAKQFYYFSSIKVLGDRSDNALLTEELEPHPFGPLGESKYLAEKFIQEHWTADKKAYIMRTALLHGKGLFFNQNAKLLLRSVLKGRPYIFGSFECKRSLTSLDNLAAVLTQMMRQDVSSGIYHLTDDDAITSSEFYRLMGKALNKNVRVWKLGKKVFWLVALVMELTNGRFNRFEYRRLSLNFVASNAKLKKALGMESMPFKLRESLIQSIREYTAQIEQVSK